MIVSCGEALIDFVPVRASDGRPAYVPCPGGSPFNIAVGIGRLGVPAGFLGGVSKDFFGDDLVAALRASRVDTRYVLRLERPSTLAFVSLAAEEPQYVFYDAESAARSWSSAEALGDDVTTLHFGSVSLLGEPAAQRLVALMAANKGHRVLSLDPNIRPNAVGNEVAYRARLRDVFALADVIKISAADFAWLAPGEAHATQAAAWLAAGASLVVVTHGGDGAVAYARGAPMSCPGSFARVVDTVGAGDSFMAALLVALTQLGVDTSARLRALEPAAIAAAVGFATRAAALTCSRRGADPPWEGEIEALASARS